MSNRIEALDAAIDKLQTAEEIRYGYDALKSRQATLNRRSLRGMNIGDQVQFDDRHGNKVRGTVTKVNRKTVDVKPEYGGRGWRVSASLLSHVEL